VFRPALSRRRDLSVAVVREYGNPRVLDVGCGSARVGELALQAGAREYVGVDFSEPMLTLARERLGRFGERVHLVSGDFLEVEFEGRFEVVIALGLFDYVAEAEPVARKMAALCSGSLVASFPKWSWLKGPIRKVRYEVLSDCPTFDYTENELRSLFGKTGLETVTVVPVGRSALLVRADRDASKKPVLG
jgi:SAM-dependent methyltransferase